MEVWDLYNENKKLLGLDHIRGKEIPSGCYHLVVRAWIKNSKGQYLIAQRSAGKSLFPLLWECVGGGALKGENSLQAAVREVKEELGIELNPLEGIPLFSRLEKHYSFIYEGWLFHYDGDIPLSQVETDEVAQAKWMDTEQITHLSEQKLLVHSLECFEQIS